MTDQPQPVDHRQRANLLLQHAEALNYKGFHATNYISAAQAHLALAAEPITAELRSSDNAETATMRRIFAQHIHTIQNVTAGPLRKVLAEKLIRPLLDDLDAAGISVSAELLGLAEETPGDADAADVPDRFIPGQRDTEQASDEQTEG